MLQPLLPGTPFMDWIFSLLSFTSGQYGQITNAVNMVNANRPLIDAYNNNGK